MNEKRRHIDVLIVVTTISALGAIITALIGTGSLNGIYSSFTPSPTTPFPTISISSDVRDINGDPIDINSAPFQVRVSGTVANTDRKYIYLIVADKNHNYIQPGLGQNVNGEFSVSGYLGEKDKPDGLQYTIYAVVTDKPYPAFAIFDGESYIAISNILMLTRGIESTPPIPSTATPTLTPPANTPTVTRTFIPLTETLVALQNAFNDVDKRLRESLKAKIAYAPPRTMELEETVTIELLLNPSSSPQELITQLVERNDLLTSTAEPGQLLTKQGEKVDVVTSEISITDRMKAVLISQKKGAFEIQELHDNADQPISSFDTTKWRWSVTAKEPGEQTLELVIYRLIKYSNEDYWREVESYNSDINVRVGVSQRLKAFDWKWILGIMITALLIPLFFRIYDNRQKKADEPKESKPSTDEPKESKPPTDEPKESKPPTDEPKESKPPKKKKQNTN